MYPAYAGCMIHLKIWQAFSPGLKRQQADILCVTPPWEEVLKTHWRTVIVEGLD